MLTMWYGIVWIDILWPYLNDCPNSWLTWVCESAGAFTNVEAWIWVGKASNVFLSFLYIFLQMFAHGLLCRRGCTIENAHIGLMSANILAHVRVLCISRLGSSFYKNIRTARHTLYLAIKTYNNALRTFLHRLVQFLRKDNRRRARYNVNNPYCPISW